jgi:hypothetical protein
MMLNFKSNFRHSTDLFDIKTMAGKVSLNKYHYYLKNQKPVGQHERGANGMRYVTFLMALDGRS